MEFGAHLPLADLGEGFSLAGLRNYARVAAESGFSWLCANDHLVFARPWLDGPTALAAVVADSGALTLATTVALPVVRGPAQLAKALSALDVLSEGRLVAGVGPGSSPVDYALAGIPFDDRWRRFDEVLPALRRLLDGDELAPRSARPDGVPLWVASWGSVAGLRRAARLGDGWIASAYNVTPERIRECRTALREFTGDGRPLPNALATTWTYVTEDPAEAERVLTDLLAPMLRRPVEALRHLPIGPAEVCAERLGDFAAAGVERVLLWPLADAVRQLEVLHERVIPALPDGSSLQARSSPG